MERIMDDFESQRKAEEIYSRRNGINISDNRKKYFSIYKFLFQFLVLINLSILFIVYSNRNWIFNSEFLKQVDSFYNVNVLEKINSILNDEENKEKNEFDDVNNVLEKETIEKSDENLNNLQSEEKNEKEKIKDSYSFIKPIDGTITSFFGNRLSENSKINGFHTGIDISAVEGTKIKSAMSGTVDSVSTQGNYGKHLRIKNDNVTTLYAHCKEILVEVGENIIQGQEIAEVGNTGNSTGPHLHFKIRYNDEYLDPNEYISF